MECKIKEECVCGTTFEALGSASFCAARYEEYLKNHKVCLINRQKQMRKGECQSTWDEFVTEMIRKE